MNAMAMDHTILGNDPFDFEKLHVVQCSVVHWLTVCVRPFGTLPSATPPKRQKPHKELKN